MYSKVERCQAERAIVYYLTVLLIRTQESEFWVTMKETRKTRELNQEPSLFNRVADIKSSGKHADVTLTPILKLTTVNIALVFFHKILSFKIYDHGGIDFSLFGLITKQINC